jgi:hypothetical protein
VVEEVIEFETELDFGPLRDLRVFEERKIKIIPARAVNDVTARVALGANRRRCESSYLARRRHR